ncbi:hypothetical protein QJQ45_023925, partial [Haematococcus lacustris]
ADQIKAQQQQQQQSRSGSLQATPSGPAAGLTGWLSSMGSWLQPQPSAPPSSSSTPSSPSSSHPFSPSSFTPTATGPAAAATLRPPDAAQQEGRGHQQPQASPGKGSGAGVGASETLLGAHSSPGHGYKPGALPPLIVARQTLKALPLLGDMLTAQLQQAEEEATLREAQQLRSGGGLKAGAKGSPDPGRAISHVGRLPLEAALSLVSGHPHHFALLGSEEDGQVASQWQGRRAVLDMAEPLVEWELRATPALLAAEEGAVQPTTTTTAITTTNNPGPRLPGLLPFPVRLPFQAKAPQPAQVQGQAHAQEQGQGQGQGQDLKAGPLALSRHQGVPDSTPAPRTPVFQLPGLALTLKTAGGQALHLVPTFISLPQLLSAVVVGRQVAARLWLRGRRSWREQFARRLEASALALSGFSPSFVPPPSSSSAANRDTEDEDDDGEGYGQPPEAKQLLQELGEPNKASAAAAAASLAAAAAARFPPDTGLAAHITQIALGVVRLSGRAFCVAGNVCDNWVADSPWGEGLMGLPPRLAVQTGFLEDVVSELALHNASLKTAGAESSSATEKATGHDAASAASDGAGAGDTIPTGQDAHLPAGSVTPGLDHGAEIGLPVQPASRRKHRTSPLAPGSKPGYWAGAGLRPTQVLECQAGVALLLEAAWMVLQEACVGDGDLAAGIAHNVAHEAASSSRPAGEVSLLMSVQLKAQALQRPTASPSPWLPLHPSSPAALSNHQLQFPTSPTPAATPAPPTPSSQHPTVDMAAQASTEAPPPSAVPAGPSPAAPSPSPAAAQATPRAQGAPLALPPSLTTHLPARPPGHTPEQPAGQAGPQPGSSASALQASVNQPEAADTSMEQTASDSPTSPQTSTNSTTSADLTAAAPVSTPTPGSLPAANNGPPAVPLPPRPTLPSLTRAPSPRQPLLPVKGGPGLLAGSREAEHKFEVRGQNRAGQAARQQGKADHDHQQYHQDQLDYRYFVMYDEGPTPVPALPSTNLGVKANDVQVGVYINTRKLFDEEALDAPDMLKGKQDTATRGLLLLGDLGLDVDDDDGELWKAPPLGFINLAASTRFVPTLRS